MGEKSGRNTNHPGPVPTASEKVRGVRLDMAVTKKSLYKTFNALGNLADKTGEIKVIVEAQSQEGIDRNWLRNAVKEPMEESGIALKITES